jgi:hypothetical protein
MGGAKRYPSTYRIPLEEDEYLAPSVQDRSKHSAVAPPAGGFPWNIHGRPYRGRPFLAQIGRQGDSTFRRSATSGWLAANLTEGDERSERESTMRRMRPLNLGWSAATALLFGVLAGNAPATAQGTPEQRAACEGDAMRLCGEFVPDVQRITACMQSKRRFLTARCRAVFNKGGQRR